jgi:hypothetical protein
MTDTLLDTPASNRLKIAKAPFSDTVLVCGKCQRKFKGAGKLVAKQLKTELKTRRWGKVRVVETKCFDLCPKRRQVLASHRTLAEHRLVVVEAGFSPEEALQALLGPPRDPAPAEDAALSLPG